MKIVVTSTKGGIGKSTVSAGIALTLVERGRRVLLCDCDLSGRCLDLILGEESHALFDIGDVAAGRCSPADALLHPWRIDALSLCPGPAVYSADDFVGDALTAALVGLEAAAGADYVICDTAGMTAAPDICKSFADTALIIATQQPASIRAAEATAARLKDSGVRDCRLVINDFEWREAYSGERAGILDIIDGSGVMCAGIVPHDRTLMLAGESGIRPPEGRARTAFGNIAARLEGEYVKLFEGIGGISKRRAL